MNIMFRFLYEFTFDRKTQLRSVKHTLITLAICSATLIYYGHLVHRLDYQLYRTERPQYYEWELEEKRWRLKRNGFDENMVKNSKIIFYATNIFGVMYNIILILFVIKEILVLVFLFGIVELILLICHLTRIENPNSSVLTGLEFMLWTLQVMVGFRYCYLLNQKINENKKKKSLEVYPYFVA